MTTFVVLRRFVLRIQVRLMKSSSEESSRRLPRAAHCSDLELLAQDPFEVKTPPATSVTLEVQSKLYGCKIRGCSHIIHGIAQVKKHQIETHYQIPYQHQDCRISYARRSNLNRHYM